MSTVPLMSKTFSNTLVDDHGNPVILARKVITSGEGSIFTTSDPSLLAKIYHQNTVRQGEKLKLMVTYKGVEGVVWPQFLVFEKGEIIGFLMPKVRKANPLPYFYHPRLRRQHVPETTWYDLHKIALSIAMTMANLHKQKVIIGDVKAENILIYPNGSPCFLDADSFQIEDPQTKNIYNSSVGSEGYIPPELIGKHLARIVRTECHDRFGLAVLVYHLLFGEHPFRGVWQGEGDPLSTDEKIYKGLTPLRKQKLVTSSPHSLPQTILMPALKGAFEKAFVQGHNNPHERPSALEWSDLLERSMTHLEMCSHHTGHFFYGAYSQCPWCIHYEKKGIDLFRNSYGVSKKTAFYIEKSMERALRSAQFTEARQFLDNEHIGALREKYEKDICEAEQVYKELVPLRKALEQSPRNDRAIGELWEMFSYKNSAALRWRGFLFQGEELADVVSRSLRRYRSFKEFRSLVDTSRKLNHSPFYYLDEFLEIFNGVSLEKDPQIHLWPEEWIEFEEKARILTKKFSFLKKSILEEQGEGILQYWDECFERLLKKEGLEIPARCILQSYLEELCEGSFEPSSLRLMATKGGYFLSGYKAFLPHRLQNKALPIKVGLLVKYPHCFGREIFISSKDFENQSGKVFLAKDEAHTKNSERPERLRDPEVSFQVRGALALGSYLFGYGEDHFLEETPSCPIVTYRIEKPPLSFSFEKTLGRQSKRPKSGSWIQFTSIADVYVPELHVVVPATLKALSDPSQEIIVAEGILKPFKLNAYEKKRCWVDFSFSQDPKSLDFKKMKLTLMAQEENWFKEKSTIVLRAIQ